MKIFKKQNLFLITNTFAFIVLGICAAEPIFIADDYEWGIFAWLVVCLLYAHRNKKQRKIIYDNYIASKGNLYTLLISGPIFWVIWTINTKITFLDKPGSLKLFIILAMVALGAHIIKQIGPEKHDDYEKRHKNMWWPFN